MCLPCCKPPWSGEISNVCLMGRLWNPWGGDGFEEAPVISLEQLLRFAFLHK